MATAAVARKSDALSSGTMTALIERVKSGDETAFNEIYSSHYERVITAVRRYISEDDIAEHVANGVFAKVWQVRNRTSAFKGGSSFATWLTRIAYNEALMYLRKNKNERQHNVSLDAPIRRDSRGPDYDLMPEFAVRDSILEGVPDRRALEHAISKIPTIYRIVFVMRVIEDMTIEEISASLGLGVPVLKSRLHRGRKIVRELLQKKAVKK